MLRVYKYRCPKCKATKEIHDHHNSTYPPEKVPCGWRGCIEYTVLISIENDPYI